MKENELKELANEFVTFLYGKTKRKKLRPLVKQLTYKGVTKKWTFDGTFLNIIGTKKSYDWELYKEYYGYNNVEDAIRGMIDKEYENVKKEED